MTRSKASQSLQVALTALLLLTPQLALAQAKAPVAPTGYGTLLLKMIVALAVVCGLAVLALKYGLKRFMPNAEGKGPLQILARLPLEPRRSLLVVKVGPKHLILASSESGISSVGEMTAEEAQSLLNTELPSAQNPPSLSEQEKAPEFSISQTSDEDEPQRELDEHGFWIKPEE